MLGEGKPAEAKLCRARQGLDCVPEPTRTILPRADLVRNEKLKPVHSHLFPFQSPRRFRLKANHCRSVYVNLKLNHKEALGAAQAGIWFSTVINLPSISGILKYSAFTSSPGEYSVQ